MLLIIFKKEEERRSKITAAAVGKECNVAGSTGNIATFVQFNEQNCIFISVCCLCYVLNTYNWKSKKLEIVFPYRHGVALDKSPHVNYFFPTALEPSLKFFSEKLKMQINRLYPQKPIRQRMVYNVEIALSVPYIKPIKKFDSSCR